ncbi:MAG: 30S ribosomal protein S2 [Bacteroidetes bacterium]|nr:30S ribosomal protein S2 [Bacteroidota bacterium]MBS1683456.1 30S ribosomal protein S2 [Bacteroidota bacterium]
MAKISHQELLDAGVHFGHLRRKWNPKMLPYIFAEKKGIHIIDLNRTIDKLDEAAAAVKAMAKAGKKILFVATKKQAKEVVKEAATRVNMPYVTDRWLGGMLTNFPTIRKSVKKMQSIEKMLADGTLESVTKKEKLVLSREKEKMERVLGGIAAMNRAPSAVFLVDITHEHIALKEAQRLNINTFGIVDTNSDPTKVDFAIPGNDDASKSIYILTNFIADAIAEGLAERATDGKDAEEEEDTNADNFERVAGLEDGGDGKKEGGRGRGRSGSGGGSGRSRIGGGTGNRGGAGAPKR